MSDQLHCGPVAELRQIARIFKMLHTLVSTGMMTQDAVPHIIETFLASPSDLRKAFLGPDDAEDWRMSHIVASTTHAAFLAPVLAAGQRIAEIHGDDQDSYHSSVSLVSVLAERFSNSTRPVQFIELSELQKVIDFQVLAMLLSDSVPQVQACEIIAKTSPSPNAKAFGLVSLKMKEGDRLLAAMARVIVEPVGDFAQCLVPLLKAGEASNTTDILLSSYADDLLTDLIHPAVPASNEGQG